MAALIALLGLAACGFQPVYAPVEAPGGGRAAPAVLALGEISIAPMPDRVGQLVRNNLLERFGPLDQGRAPRYSLEIALEEEREGLAFERDESVTRYNYRLNAVYRLIDLRTGEVLHTARSRSISAFNVVESEFATVVAAQDAVARVAREISTDIEAQLAVFFNRRQQAAG
jgi:LPS-assembly lipoprotein